MMNAYFITGVAGWTPVGPSAGRAGSSVETMDSGQSLVVFGNSREEAQEKFEGWLRGQTGGENSAVLQIKKISGAQIVNELFTEAGSEALDWPEIAKQSQRGLETEPADDFEQGYWVDVEAVVSRETATAGLEELKRDLPEDVQAGLNWSPDKQFFFLLSVLTPPGKYAMEAQTEECDLDEAADEAEEAAVLEDLLKTFPQAADREAAALVRARNSAVAAWLWRRYVAGKELAELAIRIDPWCGVMELPVVDEGQ